MGSAQKPQPASAGPKPSAGVGEGGARVAAGAGAPDVAAPRWLEQLISTKPDPLPWGRAIRAGIGIPLPIALGIAFGGPKYGVIASVGALCSVPADVRGPYRTRLRRVGLAVAAGAVGFAIGSAVNGAGVLTLITVVLVAMVSALTSSPGNNASMASLQLLVFTILSTGPIGAVVPPYEGMALFLAGGGFVLLLSLSGWLHRPTAPEREAVADVLRALANLLAAVGHDQAEAARLSLTRVVNSAYDTLLGARSRIGGHDAAYRRLFVILSECTPAIEAAVTLMREGGPAPAAAVVTAHELAVAVRADRQPPEVHLPASSSPGVAALDAGLAQIAAAISGQRPADSQAGAGRPAQPSRRERFESWFDSVISGPAIWTHALRLGLCVFLAELLRGVVFAGGRGYWITLTVAIVLKPDFGSVFARALLRGGGTVLGVLLGAAIIVGVRGSPELIAVMAVLAFLLPLAITRNYGMFATIMTPLVIVQLDLAHQGQASLVLDRLIDTTLGCAVVLVFGYLIWPGSWRQRIGGEVADVLDTVADYLERALAPDPAGRSGLRRRTYRALSDLRTHFQRVLVEPSPAARRAAAWWPVVVALERLTDAVTRTTVSLERSGPDARARVDQEEVERLAMALRSAASDARDGRVPPGAPGIAEPPLTEVSGEVAGVYAVLRGPDPDADHPDPHAPLVRRLLPPWS